METNLKGQILYIERLYIFYIKMDISIYYILKYIDT